MTRPYIIAEAAQGFQGNIEIARLLVRTAKVGGADAVKFQLVVADEIAEPGYMYYDLFCQHEMPLQAWEVLRDEVRAAGLDFITDVFGPISLANALAIGVDGLKLHSTSFLDDELITAALATGKRVYMSVGGIEAVEIRDRIARYRFNRDQVTLLYGFQAEPTPIENNSLLRIPQLRELSNLDVGFMDHVDGDSEDVVAVSAMALALGVSVFEKHITLERGLRLIDFTSGLDSTQFARYSSAIHRLSTALGSPDLTLSELEMQYRGRSVKRVVAAHPLPAGTVLQRQHLKLSRPAKPGGFFRLADAIGKTLTVAVERSTAVGDDNTKGNP